ncbi:MAG TPA: hypothetical protein VFV52_02795 [Bacilli bacterium]|nr:hypothetical protein [Bacilli bacterium]
MKMFYVLSLVALLSLSVAGSGSVPTVGDPPAIPAAPTQPSQPNEQTIKEIRADINADGKPETITLLQKNDADRKPLQWILAINKEPQFSFDTKKIYYALADLKVDDLDRNGVPEILVFRRGSGSGGASGLNIFRHYDGGYWQMFECDQQHYGKVEQQYIGNYQVKFRDIVSGLQGVIPLDPDNYKSYKTSDEREKALHKIRPWVDPISDFRIADIDGDGVKEIIAVRTISGIAHADLIGYLNTTYKLNKGSYYPQKISLIAKKGDQTLSEKNL